MAEGLTFEQRRRLAVDLFNHVWTLLERPERTPEQDDEMIHAAHASRHHWSEVGTTANLARGEWQVSRVYATLGRAEPALFHASRCLAYCESRPDEMEEWELPYAYAALPPRGRTGRAAASGRARGCDWDAHDSASVSGRRRRGVDLEPALREVGHVRDRAEGGRSADRSDQSRVGARPRPHRARLLDRSPL